MSHATHYPVNLVVGRRRCLVVGGGEVGARKAEGLAVAGADVVVVAPKVGDGVRAIGGITWHERPFHPSDLEGARLVITTTDDADLNASIYSQCEERGIWVCSADDPENCSFTLPSILRRGDLQVTVSTGGRSPALSAWLRRRLAEEIGPEYGVLVDLLAEERARLRSEGGSTLGLDWRRALDGDMLGLIRTGQLDQAREHLHQCLSSS